MGIPCVFFYVAHWSGGLMLNGDQQMTEVTTSDLEKLLQSLDSAERTHAQYFTCHSILDHSES